METQFSTGMLILGLFCNVKYTANHDGITIITATHQNSGEQLDLDVEVVIDQIVASIYQLHERANEVDR